MPKTDNEKRAETERRIVRHLIREMKKAGWDVTQVDDGGDELVTVRGEEKAMDTVFAVDDSRLYFTHQGGREAWVRFVLGNDDGTTVICDYKTAVTGFNAVMEQVERYAESQE